ncbi:ACT-like protein tyrosine kinase family protein isoform 1 [Dorcoceras hygrometricum]|uniref:ACT-like protein tyrosine kinase family protein isoform 1 n=1 Tax=Dorcoceras hygrometricum TaxID=472368 RepID=A0A2Z7B9U4_9LAMI|nr:ACT-like protein tyrosine kinase family protein isoform 1 [Dorcoceras hygrometricum]
MLKRLATSPHDPLGITDSACKNQLVVVSVQYGPFDTYIMRLVLCEELLRLDKQSRAMVNAGQRSCACDWLCWYVTTATRRGKRCALFCVLRLDDQQLVLRIEHPMRRRLDKLVRRRFEDQSMRWTPLKKLYHPTPFFGSSRGLERKHEVAARVRRVAIPHSHLPAGIVATMRRVVNYHSTWARQQQVELFDASGKWV